MPIMPIMSLAALTFMHLCNFETRTCLKKEHAFVIRFGNATVKDKHDDFMRGI